MRRCCTYVGLMVVLALSTASAQSKRAPTRTPAQPPPLTRVQADLTCPSELGIGVKTRRRFCDVLTGRDPQSGILVAIPPHRGPVTLSFELHNRHTYSEELVKAKKAFRQYTATIGVLTMDNTLIDRAIIQSDFRTAADLYDRIEGGAGPGGVKAVAPSGAEMISIELPEDTEEQVSILGETLKVLVVGGSQGARVFGEVLPAAIARLAGDTRARLALTQQCRPEHLERVAGAYRTLGFQAQLSSFFDDLPQRIADSHLVISRAGASSVTELQVAGRPAILIPFAAAADDHQTANAEGLTAVGAADLFTEAEFEPIALANLLERRLADPHGLAVRAAAARASAKPEAAKTLADLAEAVSL